MKYRANTNITDNWEVKFDFVSLTN